MLPRTIRNNNPGDLENAHGAGWQGLMPAARMTAEQKAEPRFAVFLSPDWGFRALAILLRHYRLIYKAASVADIIHRFAPSNENPTVEYAQAVASELGIGARDPIDTRVRATTFQLCKAITRFETGSWAPYWTDAQLNAGLDMAGFATPEALVA